MIRSSIWVLGQIFMSRRLTTYSPNGQPLFGVLSCTTWGPNQPATASQFTGSPWAASVDRTALELAAHGARRPLRAPSQNSTQAAHDAAVKPDADAWRIVEVPT